MTDCPTCSTPLETRDSRTFCPACVLREMWAEEEEPVLDEGETGELPTALPQVPRHRLWNKIGEGGFALVYRAEQLEPVRREVAVKVLKHEVSSQDVLARFELERQTLARMEHPGIARLWDAGQTSSGQPYFAMELVRGLPITTYCREHRLGLRERLELFIDACLAVQHAHEKGVLHRDIKPANLLVAEVAGHRQVKVIDFGIAKALEVLPDVSPSYSTAMHQAIGTPGYMSPEQAEWGSQQVDARSDIYALGVVLYELLTGSTPLEIERKSSEQAKRRAVAEEPRPPSSQPTTLLQSRHQRRDLDAISLKALERDSALRYASAASLADEVRRHLSDQPVEAAQQPWTYMVGKFARRHRALVGIGAVALFAIIVGGTASMLLYFKEQQARGMAETALAQVGAQQKTLRRALGQSHFAAAQRFKAEGDNESAALSLAKSLESDPEFTTAAEDLQMLLAHADYLQPLAEPILLKPEWGHPERGDVASNGRMVVSDLSGGDSGRQLGIWRMVNETWEFRSLPISETISKIAVASPDSLFAVVEDRTTVKLISSVTAEVVRTWTAPDNVTCLQLGAPEAKCAYVGCAEGKGVWQVSADPDTEPTLVASVQGAVKEIFFTQSPRTLLVGTSKGELRRWPVWDNREGDLLLQMPGAITCLTTVQSGSFVAVGDALGNVGWVNYSSGARKITRLHDGEVKSIALSPPRPAGRLVPAEAAADPDNAATIVSAGHDLMVRWRNLETGTNIEPPMESAGFVMRALIARDGQEVTLISRDASVRVWRRGDPNPHELRKPQHTILEGDGGRGRCFLSRREDGRALEVISLNQRMSVPVEFEAVSTRFTAMSQQRARMIGGSVSNAEREANGRSMAASLPRSLAFSPDGSVLLTTEGSGDASLWSPIETELLGRTRWEQPSLASYGLADGSFLIAGVDGSLSQVTQDGSPPVLLLDASQRLPEHSINTLGKRRSKDGDSEPIERADPESWGLAAFSNCGDAVVWAEPGRVNTEGSWVRLYCRNEDKLRRILVQRLNSIAVAPGGKRVAVGMGNGTVLIHDVERGSQFFLPAAHQTSITTLVFTPDGTGLITGSSDATVALWDSTNGSKRGSHLRLHALVSGLCVSADGSRFACATPSFAMVGDFASWALIGPRIYYTRYADALALDAKGQHLAVSLLPGPTLLLDLPRESTAPPAWFGEFVSGFASRRFTSSGAIETIEHPGVPALRRLIPKDEPGPWRGFAEWMLDNKSSRQINPWSQLSLKTYVDRLMTRGAPGAVIQARRLLNVKGARPEPPN